MINVGLEYKILYNLVIIVNPTGMPHLKITRNLSKDTTQS